MNSFHRRYGGRIALPTRSASLVPALAAYGALTLTFDIVPIVVPSTQTYYGVALSSGAWIYVTTDFGLRIAAFWYGSEASAVGGCCCSALVRWRLPTSPRRERSTASHLGASALAGYAIGGDGGRCDGPVVDGANISIRVGTLTAVMPAASVVMPVAGWVTET